MSEEKPTFKVKDRRLFNSDGTPRDIVREDEPPTPETPAPAPPAPAPSPRAARPNEPAASEPSFESVFDPAYQVPAEVAVAGAGPQSAAEREREVPQADADTQDFLMLVEFLASFAADALGMVNHPGGGGVNLPLAKQCIDMLGTLHRKTHGNLSDEEQQFLDMILSQLRMQYVSLTNAPRPPQGGRGFTGGDITGGR
jgi:hypothetical protein